MLKEYEEKMKDIWIYFWIQKSIFIPEEKAGKLLADSSAQLFSFFKWLRIRLLVEYSRMPELSKRPDFFSNRFISYLFKILYQ